MGCYVRHCRPGNLPAYIVALVGGGFLVLSALIPEKGNTVPIISGFKLLKDSPISALALIAGIGMKIAAAVVTFVTTRTKSANDVSAKSELSIKLLIGGVAVSAAILYLDGLISIFKLGGDIGPKISLLVTGLLLFVKSLASTGGLYLLPGLMGAYLLMGKR